MNTVCATGLVLLAAVSVAQPVDLSGTIRNQQNLPVPGLEVELYGTGMIDTTDRQGTFLFFKPSSRVAESPESRFRPRIAGSSFFFSVPRDIAIVSISVFDLRGRAHTVISGKRYRKGEYRENIHFDAFPSSMLILELRCDSDVARYKVVKCRGMKKLIAVSRKEKDYTRGASPPGNRIIIRRGKKVESVVDLVSDQDFLSVRLDLVPVEVLSIALSEKNRTPADIGKHLGREPYDLSRYLRREGTEYEAWCSEFVSWVYRAGGYSLSPVDDPEWVIGTSRELRRWFRRRGRWISHQDPGWDCFVPSPGDYVRYNYRNKGGHSGIVLRVSHNGDTLYTVEGNVNTMVKLLRKTSWKDYNVHRIDGFGRMSGFDPDNR